MNDYKEYIVIVKPGNVNLILGVIFLLVGIVVNVFLIYLFLLE